MTFAWALWTQSNLDRGFFLLVSSFTDTSSLVGPSSLFSHAFRVSFTSLRTKLERWNRTRLPCGRKRKRLAGNPKWRFARFWLMLSNGKRRSRGIFRPQFVWFFLRVETWKILGKRISYWLLDVNDKSRHLSHADIVGTRKRVEDSKGNWKLETVVENRK